MKKTRDTDIQVPKKIKGAKLNTPFIIPLFLDIFHRGK